MSTHEVNTDVAVLGGGCFWCLEAVYQEMRGVINVESGYMGGQDSQPTYDAVCSGATGHAEVVRLTFDPLVTSYRDILEVFFTIHDPTTLNRQGNDVGTQYRSVIFFGSAGQTQPVKRTAIILRSIRCRDTARSSWPPKWRNSAKYSPIKSNNQGCRRWRAQLPSGWRA